MFIKTYKCLQTDNLKPPDVLIFYGEKKSNNFSTVLLQTLYSRENNIMYVLPDGTNCLHLFSQIETF